MRMYYVNKDAQDNGDHEVHTLACQRLPEEDNRIYLGSFDSCEPAVVVAMSYYDQVNGCYWCARDCHTS